MSSDDSYTETRLAEALRALSYTIKQIKIETAVRQVVTTRMDSPSTRQRSSSLPARLPSSTSTKRNPALLLSEEALDLICTHITRFSSKSAIPTLSSFSLTTQHWLNPGQRALFRQPLRALRLAGPGACRVAQSLAEAIRNPILAGYVRSLEELADTASSLDAVLGRRKGRKPLLHNSKVRSIYKDDYQIGSSSDEEEEEEDKKALTTPEGRSAFAWSVHLLRSCHRVTRASFPMGTEYQARTMAKLIKTSLPKLQRIRLISTDDFTLDGEVLNEFFESVPPMREFQRLTMEGLEWDESFDDLFGGGGDGERLGLRIKELVLLEADLPWAEDTFLRFLPHQTTLTTLYISTYPYPDSIDLTTLLESLGDQLETFILKPEEDLEHYTLSSYGDTHDGYSLPITLFSSIPPALTHLTLQYGQDMTPESLLALAHSSPQLRHLDLEGTIWWTSDPDHYCGCPHWEETVCLAIEHFEQIESIHLGSLPLTVEMKLPAVERVCEERGIELQWGCCREEGESSDEEEEESDGEGYDTEEQMQRRWARERGGGSDESDESDEGMIWVDEDDEGETDEYTDDEEDAQLREENARIQSLNDVD